MPLNIKEVVGAASDTEAARNMPVTVCVFFDPAAPDGLYKCMHDAFVTVVPNASVSMEGYPTSAFAMEQGCDLAVLVAGDGAATGGLAASVRASGVPAVTVACDPEGVKAGAASAGFALEDLDVLSPDPAGTEGGRSGEDGPAPLSAEGERVLLERLGSWIVDTFRSKRLAFALAFPFVRRPLALDSVNATAAQNAGVGLVAFIPGADMPIMTLNQAKMLLQIAAAFGKDLGADRIKELAAVVGGGFAFRALARQLAAALPGAGWAVKAGVGYTGTIAMGYAAMAYFEQLEGDGASVQDALAAARAEAGRVQDAMGEQDTTAAAALAAAGTVAVDAACAAADIAVAALPVARSAAAQACSDAASGARSLARRVSGAVSSLGAGR